MAHPGRARVNAISTALPDSQLRLGGGGGGRARERGDRDYVPRECEEGEELRLGGGKTAIEMRRSKKKKTQVGMGRSDRKEKCGWLAYKEDSCH